MAKHANGETRTFRQRFWDWCAEDSAAARFERSVAQGLIGVASSLVTYYATQDPFVAAVIGPAAMAVLAPLQKVFGDKNKAGDSNE